MPGPSKQRCRSLSASTSVRRYATPFFSRRLEAQARTNLAWSPGETDWRLLGTAAGSGGVYELSTTEEMGDETFSLGTMDSLLTFE